MPNDAPRRVFRLPASARRAAADVEREIAFHLAMREADLVAAGVPADAARDEARRQFGDPDEIGAECLAVEGERQTRLRWRDRAEGVMQDLVHAVRALRRAPGFALTVALTLGVGVGATTAVATVADAVLVRALPLREPERAVALVPRVGAETRNGSPAFYFAWRETSRTLAAVAATTTRRATLLGRGDATRLVGAAVTADFFTTVGASPALGRALGRDDDRPGAPAVVVLASRTWATAFGGDPRVLGHTVQLDGQPRTIVGVMPASFSIADGDAAFWVPLGLPASQRENYTPYLTLIGRLAPGATAAAASQELTAIVRRLGPGAADDGVVPTIAARPLGAYLVEAYRTPILLMVGAVAAVLLIGCANVSTLVLARSVTRSRELAVRASLGAGRGRLVRQLAAEHLVLAALAVVVALPVAAACLRLLTTTVPADVPRLAGVTLDARTFGVAVLFGTLASLLCGLTPALHQRRLDVGAIMQGGTRTAGDRRGERWRRLFVGLEVAVAFTLVVGAGLLLRSAASLARVRTGFDVARVLTARVALPERDYPSLPAAIRLLDAIVDEARARPGVAGAALVSRVPLGGSATGVDVALDGQPLSGASRVGVAFRIASGGYFRTMGIPLVAGRDLAATDGANTPGVVVVNAAFARRLGLTATSIVGRRIRSDNGAFTDAAGAPRPLEVVGVVGDVREDGPRADAEPAFYAPMAQVSEEPWNDWIGREMLLVARADVANGDAGERRALAALATQLRAAVASVDPRLPLYDVRSTGERLRQSLAIERFETALLTLLGALGLALAALGIHGVVAYSAQRRAREVGVRLALGATASEAVALVVRQSMRPVVVGLVLGAVGAVVAGRAARGLLFGVAPYDPVTLIGAAIVLGGAGLIAAVGPARRVARVDPVMALRNE